MKKIKTKKQIADIIKTLSAKGKKIVFTNGCFDIIHRGHVEYLRKAKKMGDILIVGLNTDSSIKKIKGKKRPINKLSDRAKVLEEFESVDFIIPFSEDTPLKLINIVKPNILVKGEDWKISNIIGAKEVISKGGEVKTIKYLKGFSTTGLIERIKKYG